MKTQKYHRKQIYTIDEVLSKQINPRGNKKLKENRIVFDGDLVRMDSHRYWLFTNKGCVCVACGVKGKFFAKERVLETENYHFNLYGINKNGEEILFTKDHIVPKSKGGKDRLDNYNTMCSKCNCEKGASISE